MSVDATLEFLSRHLPRFPALRRAASWPSPLRRPLVRRWLRRHGAESRAVADFVGNSVADGVARAVRLVERDDRSFCRRVHLEGWRLAADPDDAEFELVDDHGELLWPVALRALMLFAEARPASVLAPASLGRRETPEAHRLRLAVRTRAAADGTFRVVVEAPSS